MSKSPRQLQQPKQVEVCSTKYPVARKRLLRVIGARKGDADLAATLRRLMDREIEQELGADVLEAIGDASAA